MTGTVFYCCECDARPRECDHTGRRYLPPITYEPVTVDGFDRPLWRVPERERWRYDNPPSTWATGAQRAPGGDKNQNPFHCAGCGGTLPPIARLRGFSYCSKQCREGSASRIP